MNSSTLPTCFISIATLASSTWVVKRWYWTIENNFEFEGKLANNPAASTSTE
jgi:hypothetical protein